MERNMRKKIESFAAVLAVTASLALTSVRAEATPSTQVRIPSTDTQTFGTLHLGVDNYTTMFKKKKDGGADLPTIMGLTLGVADTGYVGAEIGLDLREPTDDPLSFNGKFQIKEDSLFEYFPAIALGGYDFGTKEGPTDYNIGYVLMAKTLPIVGRVSGGYYVGNAALLKNASGNDENNGFLFSFDRTLAEIDDRLWVCVDYMGGENVYGALSFGLSWRFSPNISALIGYAAYNNTDVVG